MNTELDIVKNLAIEACKLRDQLLKNEAQRKQANINIAAAKRANRNARNYVDEQEQRYANESKEAAPVHKIKKSPGVMNNIDIYCAAGDADDQDRVVNEITCTAERGTPLTVWHGYGFWRDGKQEEVMNIKSVQWPVDMDCDYWLRVREMTRLVERIAYIIQQPILMQTAHIMFQYQDNKWIQKTITGVNSNAPKEDV